MADKGIYSKEGMPPEVKHMGMRRANLAIPVIEHHMRQDRLSKVADGSARESVEDVERWVADECKYMENALISSASDLKILESLRDEGKISEEDHDDLERWVADDTEQAYRDYLELKDMVVEIDHHFDSDMSKRVDAVFETHAPEPSPISEVDAVFSGQLNFGEMEM